MQDVEVRIIENPELENTILIEGLPGIGLVGKLAADHMLDKLNAKNSQNSTHHIFPRRYP